MQEARQTSNPTPEQIDYIKSILTPQFLDWFTDRLNGYATELTNQEAQFSDEEKQKNMARFVVNLALETQMEYPEFAEEMRSRGIKSIEFYGNLTNTYLELITESKDQTSL